MNTKKNIKYDIERHKSLFLEVGLVIALCLTLMAFEWKKYDNNDQFITDKRYIEIPEEVIPITREIIEPPKPQLQTTILEIVKDDVEVQGDLNVNIEDNQNTKVDEFVNIKDDNTDTQVIEPEIFYVVEEEPTFPGGYEKLAEYLSNEITYPQVARESGIQGIVYVDFIIEPNGGITNVKAKRGIGGGCDEEAIRVVKNMPNWLPGKQRGIPVRVQINLPIKFILN